MREQVIVELTIIIAVGIGAQWLAWTLRFPSILLLLLGGIAVGPLTGLVDPDRLFGDLLFPLVSMAVALILYEGGLNLRLGDLPKLRGTVRNLVTLGVVISWGITALAAMLILGLEAPLAALLGAILVVTGPTVIVPLLRQIRPTGPVGAILKWEGIVIDPIGAMLTVLVFEAILSGELRHTPTQAGMAILRTLIAGPAIGVAAGMSLAYLFHRFWIPTFLDNAVSLAFVTAAFTLSNRIQPESGLLATTVMGFVVANQRLADVEHIIEFKENLRVLLITGLFVVLGARMRLETIRSIGPGIALFLLVLILVQRPAAVFVSTMRSRLKGKERLFLAAVAPRGIVAAAIASIFALELERAGMAGAQLLVSATLVVIIGTVAVYGLAAAPLAKRLGIAEPNPQGTLIVGANRWARTVAELLQKRGYRVLLVDTNRHDTAAARMAGIPTYTGSILSEHVADQIDLGGLGKLLAMTASEWVNVLAVQKFARIFGTSEVYQLPPEEEPKAEKDSHHHLYGRLLFSPDADYWSLHERLGGGESIKATRLSREFDYEAFRSIYGPSALALFVILESGRLMPVTSGSSVKPKPGDTLISLVREREDHPTEG